MNISLPPEMMADVQKRAKEGKFASLSEYVRHLIRLENTDKLAKEIHQQMADIKSGKMKLYKVLKD